MQRFIFSPGVRLGLGVLIVAASAFFSVVHAIKPEYAGALAALFAVLATQGVVPPTPGSVVVKDPRVSFVLMAVAGILSYLVNVGTFGHVDQWVQGLITAVLAAILVFVTPPAAQPAVAKA